MRALLRGAQGGLCRQMWSHTIFTQAAAQEGQGAIESLHIEVSQRFAQLSQGSPPNISTGQLVQLIFEVGAADVKKQDVGEVMNTLMEHGFYRLTNLQKRDSYGPPEPPMVGLSESQRWVTMFFLQRLKREEHGAAAVSSAYAAAAAKAESLRHGRGRGGRGAVAPPCAATWCQCPPGSSGTKNCALFRQQSEQ
eukprot:TRINITY_DN34103_c0_g1_i1.p1 TRINITY_DN34103_c0_g1~~TRINITY_DN34103_c0_g1_i1.p1  ORF type:complete len:194 (-),score=35.58 TRINITY_DN34103_c0_g1_i1:21-602(-)